jgi:hypothetical protein
METSHATSIDPQAAVPRPGIPRAGTSSARATAGGTRAGRDLGSCGSASRSDWVRLNMAGLIGLSLIVACSLLIVVIAADRPSIVSATTRANYFPGWMAGPLGGLWPQLTRSTSALKAVFTTIVVVMYACYALGLRRIAALGTRWVVGAILAVQLIFFLSPPLTLTDVFNYVDYARMEVVHGLNPYATIPALEPHRDPAFALSNWHNLLSPYGPLFTIVTFAVAGIGVSAAFWVVKAALGLLSLAILALVWRCAVLLDRDPVQAIAFAGLNPIVLIWGLGGDHNDFFMVFCIVLACWLLLRSDRRRASSADATQQTGGASETAGPATNAGRVANGRGTAGSLLLPLAGSELAAGAALAAAVFVKASGAIVVPVILAALARTPRRALQTLLGVLVGGVLLALASYVAFGAHTPSLATQGSMVTGLSLPNLLGLALGLGGETAPLRDLLALALIAAVIACCVLAWRTRDLVTPAGWASLALLVTLGWVLPWYVLWALPLVALSSSPRLRIALGVFSVYLILAWVPIASDLTRAIGLHPERTSVGLQHQRAIRELIDQLPAAPCGPLTRCSPSGSFPSRPT